MQCGHADGHMNSAHYLCGYKGPSGRRIFIHSILVFTQG